VALAAAVTTAIAAAAPAGASLAASPTAPSAVASPSSGAAPIDAACPPWYGEKNLIVGCTSHQARAQQLVWQSTHRQQAGFAPAGP
jgi:hypothetical protein